MKKHMRFKGSFTIEAAVIVPLAMMILTATVFLAFILHDRVTMGALSTYTALEYGTDPGQGKSGIQQGMMGLLESRLIMADLISASVEGGNGTVRAETAADFPVPLSMLRTLLGEAPERATVQISLSGLKGREVLLLYKSICDGVSDLTEGRTE